MDMSVVFLVAIGFLTCTPVGGTLQTVMALVPHWEGRKQRLTRK